MQHSPDNMDAIHASELENPSITDMSQWYPLCGTTVDRIRIPDSLIGQFSPIVTTETEAVTCTACLSMMAQDEVPAGLADLVRTVRANSARPIDRISIDGHVINGEQFEMGSLRHNVDTGTVTITFADVRTLDIIYKDKVTR